MEHRNLGRAGLKVSAIGLGTHYFGWLHDAAASTAVIDRALELGISFIDTADVYDMGRSEEFVGKAIKGRRADLVIATKFGWPMGGGPSGAPVDPRPNARGGSRLNVIRAAEASLRRLGTDYIDLYQIHFPDPSTPIEETLRALDDLVRAGKVRYTGCSNFAAWQVSEAMWTSRCSNLNAFATSQPLYNLLQREIEQDHVPACGAHGLGLIPWGPLAGGFLTGKYRRDQPFPADSLLATRPMAYHQITTDANWTKLEGFESFARARGHTVGELAIAWLLAQPRVCSVIAGASRAAQLEEHVAAAQWTLDSAELAEIDRICTGDAGAEQRFSLR
ncbi:MAG: aldo/keto reductase [Gammaproteobacteria bacterium]|nr:aldo/keto reductase [Gammaproteobacteria bacterium]MBP6053129.1 aldo/keto reductase [Pseudomonadales bacterium]MBK6584568.1 aldo/keto reductase [Gammaproteobacteria bacterium]MBK7169225.1 aldo/keto reductase [Gammaproteobacteria bacterium]MBK7519927.1 aldo/keto reductase [Gammaproteobacteria bacterium]